MKSTLRTMLLACTAAVAAMTAQADPVTLKFALGVPEPTIWAKQARAYQEKVEELSGGQIKIEMYYGGQLGSMGDTLKSTLSGRVDMWFGSVPILSGIAPEFNTLVFPFLFDDDKQVACAVPKLTDTARKAAAEKFHFLTFSPVEHQAMAGSEPLLTPDILKGRKVRSAPSQSSINFFQSIGATPLPLPAEETPSAASTGLVEAVNFGLAYAMASGLMQTLPVYTRADLQFNLGAIIVSPRTWSRLDDAQKAAITDALSEMQFSEKTNEVLAFEKAMSDKLEQMGGKVVHLTPEQAQVWKEAARATWEQSLGELRGDATGFFEAVETAKAECGS